jgi:glyoxylase-like metal-dependent hydrolase (beta-lactamase superfamily II)
MTALTRLADHVVWMPPAPPDSPSLCAVTGERGTLMLDAGASSAHARRFLAGLDELGLPHPRLVALTHWHWDHIFGAAEIGAPVIACARTATELARMALYAWTDAALDARVATGEEVAFCADNIKLELPEPRDVRIAPADIVFDEALTVDMGGVRCRLLRVGGDHSADSVVIYVEPDGVLFLGDCLYDNVYAPTRHMTTGELFPLLEQLQQFDLQCAVEGHGGDIHSRDGFIQITTRMRLIGRLADEHDGDPAAIAAALTRITGAPLSDDDHDFIRAFASAPRLRRAS